jgi:hypothetical protein
MINTDITHLLISPPRKCNLQMNERKLLTSGLLETERNYLNVIFTRSEFPETKMIPKTRGASIRPTLLAHDTLYNGKNTPAMERKIRFIIYVTIQKMTMILQTVTRQFPTNQNYPFSLSDEFLMIDIDIE